MRVRRLLFEKRDSDPRPYEVAFIDCGLGDAYQIQVLESPVGRSVQIHVNGKQVWKGRA